MIFLSRRFFSALMLALPALPALAAAPLRLVALGDSLTAGYALKPGEDYASRLEAALNAAGHHVSIANAGVSGDTTQGGLERLDWSVPEGTQGVIVELGANDALRGLPPERAEANLDAIITKLKARGISVILCGMLAPPNLGESYGNAFNGLYPRLAQKHGVPLYPFFLEGVATQMALKLADGLHPTAEGVEVMVRNSLPAIKQWLQTMGQ